MSTLLAPIDNPASTGSGDDSTEHCYCCCTPWLALCGVVLDEHSDSGVSDLPDCERCAELDLLPCMFCNGAHICAECS